MTDKNTSDPLRLQLARVLDWEEAHVGFDKAIDGLPPDQRGALAPGIAYSVWQLVEHMRLAQLDVLDFCLNANYVHAMKWPDDYWPQAAPVGAQMGQQRGRLQGGSRAAQGPGAR